MTSGEAQTPPIYRRRWGRAGGRGPRPAHANKGAVRWHQSADRPAFDLPSPAAPRGPIPRQVPPGTVPLLAVEGTAYDCGREYGELVRERYPFYTNYRERRAWWTELAPAM